MKIGQIGRRDFIRSVGIGSAVLSSFSCSSNESASSKRPNVILVMTDDQGYGDLSCHGNPILKTPNLDQLYDQSIRLTNYHVDPTCSPTRSALMTGRYSSRTGVWHTVGGRSLLRRDEVTIADVFSGSGYKTGIFGKWHLGDNFPYRPQHRGFQETLIHGGGGVTQSPDHFYNDYFDDTYLENGEPKAFKGYCTDVWFDGALRFIEANKKSPFFCYIPTNAPHGPYLVADKYSRPYRDNPQVANPEFLGMVANIDENMGRLMQKLSELGLEKDTILIFKTDNGSSAGSALDSGSGLAKKGFNSGMRGKKGAEYDGGHRVPCFIHWPGGGLKGGLDVDKLTAHIDLLPTLIDLCGLNASQVPELDGRSLTPILLDENAEWPERTLFVHSQRIEHPEKWRKSAVMTQRWRLVNGNELYDKNVDPEQQNDCAGDNPSVVARLRSEYEAWWADISSRFGEYCNIVIGADEENPTRLTCHDLHDPPNPEVRAAISNTGQIRNAEPILGFWAVEVAAAGEYEFELRRWPREVDVEINGAIPDSTAINATEARLKIGDVEETIPVRDGDKAAVLSVRLEPGETRLQTWFSDEDGASRSAYYVYIKRL